MEQEQIPIEPAHAILSALGWRKPVTSRPEAVRDHGYGREALLDEFVECPLVFLIDWRASLAEELESIAGALARLDTELRYELDDGGDRGWVTCESDRRSEVEYYPGQSDLDDVFRALQRVVPAELEFRAAPGNPECNTWTYAVLRRSAWVRLEQQHPETLKLLFVPIPPGGPPSGLRSE